MDKIYYQIIGKEVQVAESCFQHKLPLLLKGPTGCGKTRFVEYMSQIWNRPIVTIVCNDETSAADLLGRYLIRDQDTIWQDGPVTTAVREGAILYLDEIAEAREDILTIIYPLADYRRELFVDRKPEHLRPNSGFMLIVSYNPGYQQSFKELKPSLRQRFVALEFDYPDATTEIAIITEEAGTDHQTAQKLVKLAAKIRTLGDLGLSETVSTRILIQTAKLTKSGFSLRDAAEYGLIQVLTDEQDTAEGMRDIVRAII